MQTKSMLTNGVCLASLLISVGCVNRPASRAGSPPSTLSEKCCTAIHSTPTEPSSLPVRIVAYNVHLLPDLAARVAGKRSKSNYRAQAIGEQLAAYDLVGISEAFDRDYSQTLLDTLQAHSADHLSAVQGPQRSGRHLIGSGLMLLSRWPIEVSHTMTYSHASRFFTSGFKADGFAAKGAVHARLQLGDDSSAAIDCFLTHLESQSSSAREKQIAELAEFIAEYASVDLPMVVMGDFNVTADSSFSLDPVPTDTPYQKLLRALSYRDRQLIDVGTTCHQHGHHGTSDALAQDGDRRIDYIFLSNPTMTTHAQLAPVEACTLPMFDNQVPEASLSDHLAVACQTRFRWSPRRH